MAGIQIENLTYTYPDKEKPALEDVSLQIPSGAFVVLVGGSGSGKSTLLRAMAGLVPSFYGGTIEGSVCINGENIEAIDRRQLVQQVGMVFQDPESQLVMTTPEDEVAFGLENIEMPDNHIRRRIMEVVSALSFNDYRKSFIPELSGGQKQKVAMASVLAMHPGVLLLDEPTSQLDPIAAEDILTMIRRLNEENGITVIISEQKLERCFHFADRIIALEDGQIIKNSDAPSDIARWSVKENKPFVPALSRLFAAVDHEVIPVTVKEGRSLLENDFAMEERVEAHGNDTIKRTGRKRHKQAGKQTGLLTADSLWFTYPNGNEVLKDVSLSLQPGSVTALIGANGSGKTTLIKQLNGLLRPDRGHVTLMGQETKRMSVETISESVAYLSQDPNDYLFLPTVKEEVAFSLKNRGIDDPAWVQALMKKLDIHRFEAMNPRDLSVGERQRVAFASVLATKPKVILLDEPTRGLDYTIKDSLGELIHRLRNEGSAILIVAHDIEFIAEHCDEVVLMDDGRTIEKGDTGTMLANSTFYSPQMSRLFHGYAQGIVTLKQGIELLSPDKGEEYA